MTTTTAVRGLVIFAVVAAARGLPAQVQAPPVASQNPSPMAESTRAHDRLTQRPLDGVTRSFPGPLARPVEVFIPKRALGADRVDLVIHFHGAGWIAGQSVASFSRPTVAAAVNLGAGSGAYHRAFTDPTVFDSLVSGIGSEVSAARSKPATMSRITLSGFSAGHGAIRVILREPRHFARVDAVLLLDGMHTSYVPEGTVLAAGGALDTSNLAAFAHFARAASRREKRFVVSHSEIFPGTFASTTETADWLLNALGLRRTAVLRWGPRGMQQLSEATAGQFHLLGYAGNSAPDHIDQFHAMPELLSFALGARRRP